MATPVELSLEDIRAVSSLVRDVCDRWDDPRAWREYFLQGTCALLRANYGSVVGQEVRPHQRLGTPRPIAVVGMPEELQRRIFDPAIETTRDQKFEDFEAVGTPGFLKLFTDFSNSGWATAARSELTDDATHHASTYHLAYRQPAGCDDYVISVRAVDAPTRVEVITIDRPPGAERFSPRDVWIMKLLHDEIAPLVGVRLATEDHLSRDGLSRRLRETLDHLLRGQSEKEVAKSLGLSGPTVHQYVGMLYRHFKVQNRAGLMAYFIHRRPRPIGPSDKPHAG